MSPHSVHQRLLPSGALGADLGKAGGDDADRSNARRERVVRGGEHASRRHADEREIDRRTRIRESGRSRHSPHGLPAQVDRNDGSGKVPCEDVPEEFAPDRASARRRAIHGDPRRREECTEGSRDTDVIAIVDPFDVVTGRLDRHRRLDHPASRPLLHGEARAGHHSEHLTVAVQDLEHQSLDPCCGSASRRAARGAACPTPMPCISSETANATSAAVTSRKRSKLARATTRSSPPSPSTPISAPRELQSGSRNGSIRHARACTVA